MRQIRVAQQFVSLRHGGGLKTEYSRLMISELASEFQFLPVELNNCHSGVNFTDFIYYYRAFRKANADIIHIRGAGVESLNAVVAAKLCRKSKTLVTVHGLFSELVYYPSVKRWLCKNIIEQLIFFMADGISCVCETTAKKKIFDRYQRKMLPVVYNRMPKRIQISVSEKNRLRTKFGFSENEVIGIYTGRITKEKGLEFLAEALSMLDRNWPSGFVFLIVGDGEYSRELQDEINSLNNSASVHFFGYVDYVDQLLLISDFFLLPSLHENCSISILEACAVGLPCLVTNVGGNPEIVVHQRNGLLIPPFSAKAISEGIENLCSAQTRCYFKEHIEKMDYEAFYSSNIDIQLRSVYKSLLSKERGND